MKTACVFALFLALAALEAPLRHPDGGADRERKALAILAGDVGTWDCRWENLDEDENVVSVVTGTERIRAVFGERVLEMETELPEHAYGSRGLKFYEPNEKKILFVDVDQNGEYWIMEQDVETREMLSAPHLNADGTTMQIRFLPLDEGRDEKQILMERSSDGGRTWVKGFYLFVRRVPEGDETPR